MPSRGGSEEGGRRTPRKSTDQWKFSPSPAYTASPATTRKSASEAMGRNPITFAVRAIGSCFVPRERSPPPDFSEDCISLPSYTSSSTGSKHRSSYGSYEGGERRQQGRGLHSRSSNSSQREQGGFRFTIQEIHRATKNFDPALKIGQGGFGTVYKGKLDDGTFVAIKRAKKIMYDSHLNSEFQSEIQTLAQIEHLNLVRFLGYFAYGDERIVVVEYVPNGTLREHLDCLHGLPLDLAARLDIAIDVAHAVTYLHMYTDHPIIHRDIKSSNILLTENFRAKVADFGFARLGATEAGVSHVETQVKGTAGYLDPEYLRTYQLTEKSDVYSFGVLLVELLTGRRPIEPKRELKERITPKWTIKMFVEGKAIRTLDPNLPVSPATNLALEKVLELALQCLAPTRQSRPSMRKCAELLWSIRKDYRELLAQDPFYEPSTHRRNASATSSKEEKR